MEFTKSYKTETEIHHGFYLEEYFGAIDNRTNICLFHSVDEKSDKLEPLITKEFNSPVLHPLHKADTSTKDGSMVAIFIKEKNTGVIFKYDVIKQSYEKHAILSWSKGGIEYMVFSEDEKILVVGGADGKVYLYSTEHGKLLEIIAINSEYISSVAIAKDNNLVAFSSFKKNLDIYDLRNNLLITRHIHKEVISVAKFMNKSNFLIYGARDNQIILYDFIDNSVKKELAKTINWPVSLLIEEDDSFCLVSDKSGHVFFIDLYNVDAEAEVLFHAKHIVVNMKKEGSKYYFFMDNGDIEIFDIDVELLKVEEAYNEKDYEKFFELTKTNPLLRFKGNTLYENANEEFEFELDSAIDMIANNQIDQAKELIKPFLGIDRNKEKFNFYVINAPKIITFKEIVDNHDYDKAYALAQSGSYYKRLPMYKIMEEEFEQTFNMAEMLLVEDPKNIKKAQTALQHYATVGEKKNVIAALFKAPKVFKGFDELFNDGKLESFYKKSLEFPQVKEAPIYKEFLNEIDSRIKAFLKAVKDKEYHTAYDLAKGLQEHVPENFLKSLRNEFERIEKIREFAAAMEKKDYKAAISLVSKYPFLISLDEYSELEKFLNKRFDMAIRYAFHGKVEGVHKFLGKFLSNPYTRNRAIKTYKIAYIHQISVLGKKMSTEHWKKTFMNYVTRFGVDAEIETVAKRFDQDDLLERFNNVSKQGFEKLPLLANIVKGK